MQWNNMCNLIQNHLIQCLLLHLYHYFYYLFKFLHCAKTIPFTFRKNNFKTAALILRMLMRIMMMMMNCFYGMVDRWKVFSLISRQDHCQRSSPSQISDTRRAGFEPAQNLSSSLIEWSCAKVITTTPRRHNYYVTPVCILFINLNGSIC